MNTITKVRVRNALARVFPALADRLEDLQTLRELRRSREKGLRLPLPPLIKRLLLKAEFKRIDAVTLVETGTYLGDTVWFFRGDASRIVSIEVQPQLAELARRRFDGFGNVEVLVGDSSDVLPTVIGRVHGPVLYWLDGHYSAGVTGRGRVECPIWDELSSLRSSPHDCSVFIDDARLFGVDIDYPPIDMLVGRLREQFPLHSITIENDIVQVKMP